MTGGERTGVCLNCGREGEVGHLCPGEACRTKGYAFVPKEYAIYKGVEDLFLGRMIDDYLVVAPIGKGGFGAVYLALMQPMGKEVALKIMHDRANSEARIRFRREAKALSALENPHIVRLLWYGEYKSRPYMVMEYVRDARSLSKEIRDRVKDGRGFLVGEVARIIGQLLEALSEAHSLGIIHRDIKPANILLQNRKDDPMYVKVLDFGLAKFFYYDSKMSVVMGTPRYMAPEQFRNTKAIGPWTDLYAVGVLAFELFTGVSLFSKDHEEVLIQKLDPKRNPFERIANQLDLPQESIDFFRKALAQEPQERFRRAQDFWLAFEQMLAHLDSTQTVTSELEGLLDSSELRRMEEGSTTQKARILPVLEKELTETKLAVPKARAKSKAEEKRHKRIGSKTVTIGGLLIVLLAIVGGLSFLHQTKEPARPQVSIRLWSEAALSKGRRTVVLPVAVERDVEVRPVYQGEVVPNVVVKLDGVTVGKTGKGRGVSVRLGTGRHILTLEGEGIKTVAVPIMGMEVSGTLKVPVELVW